MVADMCSLAIWPFMVMGKRVVTEPKLVAMSMVPANWGGASKSMPPYDVEMSAMMPGGAESEQVMSMPPKLVAAVMAGEVTLWHLTLPYDVFRSILP